MIYDDISRADCNIDALTESYLISDLSRMNEAHLAEFTAPGGVGESLVEAGKMAKKTLVRLSKIDDLERRTTMAAMRIAMEKKDPLFDKLAKNRVKEKELLSAIKAKYGHLASKNAKIAQAKYIKTTKKLVNKSFMTAGGEARV